MNSSESHSTAQPDAILIQGLRVATRIGVPDEERAEWQTLALDLEIVPEKGFEGIEDNDDLADTINYYDVSIYLRETSSERPRRLIETLANDLAAGILEQWPVKQVTLTVRKFILPDTDHVAVRIVRSRL